MRETFKDSEIVKLKNFYESSSSIFYLTISPTVELIFNQVCNSSCGIETAT